MSKYDRLPLKLTTYTNKKNESKRKNPDKITIITRDKYILTIRAVYRLN